MYSLSCFLCISIIVLHIDLNVALSIPTFSNDDNWDSMEIQNRFENALKNIGIAQWEIPEEDKLLYNKIRPSILSFFESTRNWPISIKNNNATMPINDDIDFQIWRKQEQIMYGFMDRMQTAIPVQSKYFIIPFMKQNGIDFMKYKSNPFKDNEDIINFGNNMIKHCQFILKQIFKYLSFEEKHISMIMGKEDMISKHLMFNYYDPNISNRHIAKYGFIDHFDFGFITILLPSSDGLQFEYNNNWIDVPFSENKYIVNFGELFNYTTNGQIKSTRHRVKVIQKNVRISIAMFYDPDSDGNIYKYDEEKKEFVPIKTMKKHYDDSFKRYHDDFHNEKELEQIHNEL